MRKRVLILCAAWVILLLAGSAAYAGDRVSVSCGSFPVRFESEPFTEKGVTYVPLRDICAALGARLEWYSRTQDIIVESDDQMIHMAIGSKKMQSNGTDIQMAAAPRLIGGRTYVSLRAIADGLGKELKWDETTATVQLSMEQNTVNVSTAEELINAIQPNTKIVMEPGDYNLSMVDWSQIFNPLYIYRTDVYGGGYQFVAYDIKNLSIVGNNSRILVEPRYADVMKFVDCRMVSIEGISAGHTGEVADCKGDVFEFKQCRGVRIENCVLNGGGARGLVAVDTQELTMVDSSIRDCSLGFMNLKDSQHFLFEGTTFFTCTGDPLIQVSNSRSLLFAGCSFADNRGKALFGGTAPEQMGNSLTFRKCNFTDNQFLDGEAEANTSVVARYE